MEIEDNIALGGTHEQQLKRYLIEGIKPSLRDCVNRHCINTDRCSIQEMEPYCCHGMRLERAEKEIKVLIEKNKETILQIAEIQAFEQQAGMGRGVSRGRGRREVPGRSGPSPRKGGATRVRWRCGSTDHLIRDCPL